MTELRYFSLGRHAMKVALEVAGVKRGDSVMLPGFICRDLISSLHTIGAKPVFYAVDADFNPEFLDVSINPSAIVAVNYFGFAQDLNPFREFCKATGAKLIEDNAHGFLSRDSENNKLGQRTAFGITSFRKTLQVAEGAILSISSDDIQIPDQLPYVKSGRNLRQSLLALATRTERATKIPTMSLAQSLSQFVRRITTGSSIPISAEAQEREIPGVANPTSTSMKKLLELDKNQEIDRRRLLFEILLPQIIALGATPIYKSLPIGVCPYGIPFRAQTELLNKIKRLARLHHVSLATWPDLPKAMNQSTPEHYTNVCVLNFR